MRSVATVNWPLCRITKTNRISCAISIFVGKEIWKKPSMQLDLFNWMKNSNLDESRMKWRECTTQCPGPARLHFSKCRTQSICTMDELVHPVKLPSDEANISGYPIGKLYSTHRMHLSRRIHYMSAELPFDLFHGYFVSQVGFLLACTTNIHGKYADDIIGTALGWNFEIVRAFWLASARHIFAQFPHSVLERQTHENATI